MTTPTRWELAHAPYPDLASVAGVAPLQVQLLRGRGVPDAAMRAWVEADVALASDPTLLPDSDRAAAVLHAAVTAGERIVIVGDCDVDGLTATAIMEAALGHLGANLARSIVSPRLDDGRGLTMATVAEIRRTGARLCVTVDNGSSSVEEVAALAAEGIRVVITDHHHVPQPAPAAEALVNPQRADSRYPHPEVSGAGVSLGLAQVLLGMPSLADDGIADLVALAGMGTLADVVPLGAENHLLVARAVRELNARPRPGIAALLRLARIELPLTPRDIAFGLAPRLNAAGRLGDPHVALDLLTTTDPGFAQECAQRLDGWNSERQRLTDAMAQHARGTASAQVAAGDPIIFVTGVAGADWQMGMVGLVAARLAEEFGRLAVVVAQGDEMCRGSLRGPRGFDIGAALAASDPPLAAAGGHAGAGGFSIPVAQLPALRAYLTEAYGLTQGSAASVPEPLLVDASLPLGAITPERAALVAALAPFGAGFREPLFVSPGVTVSRAWAVGGFHTKVTARDGDTYRTFFWRRQRPSDLPSAPIVDVVWQMPARLRDYEVRHAPEPLVVAVLPHDAGDK